MAELKEKELKILSALSQLTEPARPTEIGELAGENPLNTGRSLTELSKGQLAVQTDKVQNLWAITETGGSYMEEHKQLTEPVTGTVRQEPPSWGATIPSQADVFRTEGQRLGFGARKGDIKLDAVVNYVERVADLDNLSSVWNALTEMGVANDVKKRWIKLYAQTLPNKEIPTELKAKLEAGTEAEQVAEKEVPARAKSFSVIGGQIMPDPEGEYSFSMAIQKAMVDKGASSNQATEMATTFAKMNTDTMNVLIPLLTKEPEGTSVIQLLITQLGELQKEIRAPQGASEGNQQIQALTQQLSELRDTLHNEQLARIQDQNQATAKEMIGYIKGLENRLAAITEGKQAESKIGLMSHALDTAAKELTGIRSDLKPLAQTFLEGKVAPGEKTAAEKAGFGTGLDKGIKRAHEATQLENELFFAGGSSSE